MKNNKGFTLIELSIVIVIIGLIVAGVVGGQALVEQAKIRSVLTQMNQIKIGVNAYKLEYGQLPGDHDRAADYWGQAANCNTNLSGSTNTCNGNGSGKLSYDHACDSSGTRHEMWHFWKHLSNAELIEGDFTASSTGLRSIPGENVPKGPIEGTGWTAFSVATCDIGRQWIGRPTNQRANRMVFSNPNAPSASGTWFNNAVALSAQQQFAIDNKLDDGLPYQGIINDMSATHSGFSIDCATVSSNEFGNNPPGTTTVNATYDLSFKGAACIMFVDLE